METQTMFIRCIDGKQTEKMEEEKPNALEMGKEEKETLEEEDEEESRRIVAGTASFPYPLSYI
ncbi:MAG: hypothetical protein ACP5NX_03705 [Candidatus Bilamarchaeaceae archaeon]